MQNQHRIEISPTLDAMISSSLSQASPEIGSFPAKSAIIIKPVRIHTSACEILEILVEQYDLLSLPILVVRLFDDILKKSKCNSRKTAVTRDACKFSELTEVLQSSLCAQQGAGAACSDSSAEPYISSAPGHNRHLGFLYRTPRERNLSSLPHLD